MLRTTLTYLALVLLLPQCMSQGEKYTSYDQASVPFDFNRPDYNQKLPDELYEISGIAWFDGRLACVEDEHGKVYLWDIAEDEIVEEYKFAKKGDFEGIEVIGEVLYAIESNGDLYRFTLESDEAEKIETPFSRKNDVEGLGVYNNHLLVACKADGDTDGQKVSGKAIYTLDPDNPKEVSLLFEISRSDLRDFIETSGRPGKVHEFDPSGIAYDSKEGLIYVLSADQVLVVVTDEGEILEVVFLDPKTFRQPEGICFDDKGSLYLSSEGAGAPARIYRFDRN